jgi:hypothetical protein
MLVDWLAFVLIALLGLVFCFLGYRAFLVLLPVWGFLASLAVGFQFSSFLFAGRALQIIFGLVIGGILGIVVAAMAYWLFTIGFTLVAAIFAGSIANAAMSALGISPGFLQTIVFLAVVIGTALLIVIFHIQKYAIIVLTALVGADLIVLAGLRLVGAATLADLELGNLVSPVIRYSGLSLAAFLVFFGLGIVVQVMINRNYEYTPRIVDHFFDGER